MHRSFLHPCAITLVFLAIPTVLSAQGPGSGEVARGLDCAEQGNYDKAVEWYNEALRVAPNWGHVYFLRGHMWHQKGEFDKATADYSEALRRDPDDVAAYVGRGISWCRRGEYDKAIADFDRALQITSSDVYFHYNFKQSKFDKDTTDGKAIVRLRHADAYLNRGNARNKKGEYDKAIADYNEALRIRPEDSDALSALARLQATCPDAKYRDGKRALENANRAYEKDGGANWRCIDTLAAACAENGDFEKACQWQEKAIQLAGTDDSARDRDKEELLSRLDLYRAKKPYRGL